MIRTDHWNNKWIFVLIATLTAIWLWNLRKFPYQIYLNWWASFIVAYIIALLIIGIWLLIWEVALWQKTQEWWPNSFGWVDKYLKWIWWLWVLIATLFLSYFVVIIWRWVDYLWVSIQSLWTGYLPWWNDTAHYFMNIILNNSLTIHRLWTIAPYVIGGTFISWILIYFFSFKSTKLISKFFLFTSVIPIICLLIIVLRWITLPWAMEWLRHLITFDITSFMKLSTWTSAIWQVLFSLWIAMGIMITLWAHKKPDSEIVKSSVIVALSTTIVSLLITVAIFWTIWYMITQKWISMDDLFSLWSNLTFIVIPQIIYSLPALNWLFSIMFFGSVCFLSLYTAICLIETITISIKNKIKTVSIEVITLTVCTVIWLMSLVYTFGNWLYVMDIVDHYIMNFAVILVWLFEAIVFIYLWKEIWEFIDQKNECLIKIIMNKSYLKISWIISIISITILLYMNIKTWILSYRWEFWWYDQPYLVLYWIFPLAGIFILWLLINLAEETRSVSEPVVQDTDISPILKIDQNDIIKPLIKVTTKKTIQTKTQKKVIKKTSKKKR